MKVTTEPVEQKPNVVITLPWEEARMLRTVVGGISGAGRGRKFTSKLYNNLEELGLSLDHSISFHGSFS